MRDSNRLLSPLILATLCIYFFASFVGADEMGGTCSDMSEHQQELDAGREAYHGGEKDSSPFSPSTSPLQFAPNARRPIFPEGAEYDYQPHILPVDEIATMHLNSLSDVSSAEVYAQGYECTGDYLSAKRIYQRILNYFRLRPDADKRAVVATQAAFERIQLYQLALQYYRAGEFDNVDKQCAQILEQIRSTENLDLKIKLALVERAYINLSLSKKSEVGKRAENYCADCRRELQCLFMADDLNSCAFKLELSGDYTMAETLYREALAIKIKNLGANNPETLAQNGELAQLYAAQGRIKESTQTYEQALAGFRKLPIKTVFRRTIPCCRTTARCC